jgi:hypothetical protein
MAKSIKLTEDELFELLYTAYKDGDYDSQTKKACLGAFQIEFNKNVKPLFK